MFADGDSGGGAQDGARLFSQAFETLTDFAGVDCRHQRHTPWRRLEVALVCDLRALPKLQAQMALPEATVILAYHAGGTQNLPWLGRLRPGQAHDSVRRAVDAATAEGIGLVGKVVPLAKRNRRTGAGGQGGKQSPSSVTACKA